MRLLVAIVSFPVSSGSLMVLGIFSERFFVFYFLRVRSGSVFRSFACFCVCVLGLYLGVLFLHLVLFTRNRNTHRKLITNPLQ